MKIKNFGQGGWDQGMWSYFNNLLNRTHASNLGCLTSSLKNKNVKYTHRIRVFEIKRLKKGKIWKVVDNLYLDLEMSRW